MISLKHEKISIDKILLGLSGTKCPALHKDGLWGVNFPKEIGTITNRRKKKYVRQREIRRICALI